MSKIIINKNTAELEYKVKFDKTPKHCEPCNKTVRTDSYARHLTSKKHIELEKRAKEFKQDKPKIIKLKDVKPKPMRKKNDKVLVKDKDKIKYGEPNQFDVIECFEKSELEKIIKNCKILKNRKNGSVHFYDKSKYETFKHRYERDAEFKEKHLKNVLKRIECECGRSYLRCHRARHLRSPIHKRKLEEKLKKKDS